MAEDHTSEFPVPPSGDVFVSYASQDAAVANATVEALEKASLKCWIAPRDVRAGALYAEAIIRALSDAKAIVLVLSANAIASSHVGKEIERASSKKRPIIALRIDAAPLTPALEYFLSESQWIEAQSGSMKSAYAKLIEAIRELDRTAPTSIAAVAAGASARAAPTARSRFPRKRILLGAALAAVAVALAAFVAPRFWLAKHVTAERPASVATRVVSDRSIAVLPFENRSAKQDDAYFADGIHDDILTQLTKIGALKVIAGTSVEQFRNTRLTTKVIGGMLGVTRVLEGGVQRAGDRVRITVQLIDAATDAHLWAESYDRKLTATNIFAIQSEIAAAIASALKAALTPAEQTRLKAVPTQNLDAWEAYQLGRQRGANSSVAGLAEAVKYLQKAIDLDPEFALAYAVLADTLMVQIGWAGVPKAANYARAEQLARKAMELDPNLAESWVISGLLAEKKGDSDRAEADYRKAITLNPGHTLAYKRFASLLSLQGRSEDAVAFGEKAFDLDPLSAGTNFAYARDLLSVGRFDEAATRYRKVIELDPSRPNVYRDLAMLNAYAWNRFAEAVPFAEKLVELDPDAPYARCNLAGLYIDLGDLTQAARVLEMARKRAPGSAQVLECLAYVRLWQGNESEAARLARKTLAIDPSLSYVDAEVFGLADVRRGDYASARARYARAFPEMLKPGLPEISALNFGDALEFAYILQMTGEAERENSLLARAEQLIRKMPRLSENGYGIADVQILALRGEKTKALETLRLAENAGWRSNWQYYRDFALSLSSIRNEPEFKAVFANIERDMARQRADLAARPKNTPLDFTTPMH